MNRALRTQQTSFRDRGPLQDPAWAVVPSPGQGHPHSPASREPLGGSVLHLRGEGQTSQDPSGFGLSSCSSDGRQLLIDLVKRTGVRSRQAHANTPKTRQPHAQVWWSIHPENQTLLSSKEKVMETTTDRHHIKGPYHPPNHPPTHPPNQPEGRRTSTDTHLLQLLRNTVLSFVQTGLKPSLLLQKPQAAGVGLQDGLDRWRVISNHL